MVQLLQSALSAAGGSVADILVRLPVMQRPVSAQMLDVLDIVTTHGNKSVLKVRLQLPASKQVTASQLVPLLSSALQSRQILSVELLLDLPAAKEISVKKLSVLVHAALAAEETLIAATWLLKIPAAAELSPAAVAELLERSLQSENIRAIWWLVGLPGAQLLSIEKVGQLLALAVEHGLAGLVAYLARLPAAAKVAGAVAEDLLEGAVQQKAVAVVKALVQQLPPMRGVTGDKLVKLLGSAVGSEGGVVGALEWLLQLPAAAELSPGAVGELVQRTLQSESNSRAWAVRWLVGLPGAQLLSIEKVGQLLGLAVEQGLAGPVAYLARLPAAANVAGAVAEDLLEVAVQQKAVDVVRTLVQQLPPVGGVTVDKLMQLVGSAVGSEGGVEAAVEWLLQLPAAQHVSSEQLLQLLRVAVAAGHWQAGAWLVQLPAGREVTGPEEGYELLALALQPAVAPNRQQLMRVLLVLPGCRALTANHVFNLLLKLCYADVGGLGAMGDLLLLEGAGTMHQNLVCRLLGLCIEFGNWEGLMQMMLKLPGAQQITSDIVEEQLLGPAVKAQIGPWYLGCVLALQGAQHLSWEAAFRLVELCCNYHPQGLSVIRQWMGREISDVGELGELLKAALASSGALCSDVAVEVLRSAADLLQGLEFQELKGLLLVALEAGAEAEAVNLVVQELLWQPGAKLLREQGVWTAAQLQLYHGKGLLA